jgi:hypothetical protein
LHGRLVIRYLAPGTIVSVLSDGVELPDSPARELEARVHAGESNSVFVSALVI